MPWFNQKIVKVFLVQRPAGIYVRMQCVQILNSFFERTAYAFCARINYILRHWFSQKFKHNDLLAFHSAVRVIQSAIFSGWMALLRPRGQKHCSITIFIAIDIAYLL